MKRSNLISLILLSILFAGCGGSNPSTEGFITVDVTKSYPEKKFVLQDLFDIEYLPLETTDEFVTTASLQYIDEDLIIMTNGGRSQTGNIYLVDRKSGKCLRVISHRGQGAEEYVFLRSVIYDKENKELYVNDSMTQRILVYGMDGKFKRSLKHKEHTFYSSVYNFDKEYLIGYADPSEDPDMSNYEAGMENGGFMLISKIDGSTRKIETPYKIPHATTIIASNPKSPTGKFYYSIQSIPLVPLENDWLLMEASSDTIYQYSVNHQKKPFIVRAPSVDSMNPEIYLYPGVVADRYYFMQTIKKEFDTEKGEGFESTELVYDRQENAIYNYVVYNDDFTNERKANLVWGYPCIPIFVNNDGIAFMTRLDVPDLMEAYEKGKLKGKLKEIAAGLNEDSNPVIMIAKYKK